MFPSNVVLSRQIGFIWFLSFSILLEFFPSISIALYHLARFNTFSSTMIASHVDPCDPFSTKDAVGDITGPALDRLFICARGKEIMLMYP
jgi:hypothetical protein